jgi:hypothetical protein
LGGWPAKCGVASVNAKWVRYTVNVRWPDGSNTRGM